MGLILLIVLVLLLLGAVPAWPHSRNWGYAPSGGLGLLLVIVLVLVLMRVLNVTTAFWGPAFDFSAVSCMVSRLFGDVINEVTAILRTAHRLICHSQAAAWSKAYIQY
jgi:hypothetical protein